MADRAVGASPSMRTRNSAHDGVLLDGHRRRVDRRGEAVEAPRHREPQRRRQPGARRVADHDRAGEQVADALMTARAEDHQHPGDAPRRDQQIDEPAHHPQHCVAEADRRALQRDGAQADGPLADASRRASASGSRRGSTIRTTVIRMNRRRPAGRLVEAQRGEADDDRAEQVDRDLHAEVEQRGEQAATPRPARLQFEHHRLGRDDPVDGGQVRAARRSSSGTTPSTFASIDIDAFVAAHQDEWARLEELTTAGARAAHDDAGRARRAGRLVPARRRPTGHARASATPTTPR